MVRGIAQTTGIGSLDIIPDPDSEQIVPSAFVRLWNSPLNVPAGVTPFGSTIPRIMPREWRARQESARPEERIIYIPGGPFNFRRSFGFRTVTQTTYSVFIVHVPGFEEKVVSSASLPADFTMLQSFDQLLGRTDDPRKDIRVVIESGSSIGFYSYTHNFTNDATVIVAPAIEDTGSLVRQ